VNVKENDKDKEIGNDKEQDKEKEPIKLQPP
jgi:hypothetical protein